MKRSKQDVTDDRWAKKERTGKVIADSYEIATPVTPLNPFQAKLDNALHNKKVIVVDAPAGCGKSFITMSYASDRLKNGNTDKIVIARPNVLMGLTIGLLPGDINEKMEPLVYPLIEVMTDRYGKGFYELQLKRHNLEMLPLEYVRGRNLKCITIVDEAQNVKPSEAYTLLTRLATGGQLILIGDSTQNDHGGETGLQFVAWLLAKYGLLKDAAVLKATSDDIVRDDFVKHVVMAMEEEMADGFIFDDKR